MVDDAIAIRIQTISLEAPLPDSPFDRADRPPIRHLRDRGVREMESPRLTGRIVHEKKYHIMRSH